MPDDPMYFEIRGAVEWAISSGRSRREFTTMCRDVWEQVLEEETKRVQGDLERLKKARGGDAA